jgi:hypothetical protein
MYLEHDAETPGLAHTEAVKYTSAVRMGPDDNETRHIHDYSS